MKRINKETVLWTAVVLIISYVCYLPMFLDKKGMHISELFISVKYLFIIVPGFVSMLFAIKQKCLKKWLLPLFTAKVLIVSLLHMIFNTCFIAPVKYNVILLGIILISAVPVVSKTQAVRGG